MTLETNWGAYAKTSLSPRRLSSPLRSTIQARGTRREKQCEDACVVRQENRKETQCTRNVQGEIALTQTFAGFD